MPAYSPTMVVSDPVVNLNVLDILLSVSISTLGLSGLSIRVLEVNITLVPSTGVSIWTPDPSDIEYTAIINESDRNVLSVLTDMVVTEFSEVL
jgi:hypothetical protein